MNGFHGKIIRVDLTTATCKVESLGETLTRDYIGGRGIGAKILFDEVDPKTVWAKRKARRLKPRPAANTRSIHPHL